MSSKRTKKLLEEVFPTKYIKFLCISKSIYLKGNTFKVKRLDPKAIILLQEECKIFTDKIVRASSSVMRTYNRAFNPNIVQYVLKSMGMKTTEKKDILFPRSVFHKYVRMRIAHYLTSSKLKSAFDYSSADASDVVQYAVETNLDTLIRTALLFVVVYGKHWSLVLKKEDVIAALIAKQQYHDRFIQGQEALQDRIGNRIRLNKIDLFTFNCRRGFI